MDSPPEILGLALGLLPKSDLKQARLVSKAIEQAAVPHLFNEVSISTNDADFPVAVRTIEHFPRSIKTLVFSPVHYGSVSWSTYKKDSRAQRRAGARPSTGTATAACGTSSPPATTTTTTAPTRPRDPRSIPPSGTVPEAPHRLHHALRRRRRVRLGLLFAGWPSQRGSPARAIQLARSLPARIRVVHAGVAPSRGPLAIATAFRLPFFRSLQGRHGTHCGPVL